MNKTLTNLEYDKYHVNLLRVLGFPVGDGEKGDGSAVHDHRVFSMLFGPRGWVRVKVWVIGIVRVRLMGKGY